ncbi:hypothetical protein DFJ75_3075 [Williamsia muralis]|uniref:Uncharacterized protein n=1 Tax=Williamsia marianensis TaxID=85044 RepID=A0A495K653_WILMA|nr:hypothetical protein [Williamsia muralis]RKR96235.1 hypothetical protein DFJ75_3075 [Williamsia muralis]
MSDTQTPGSFGDVGDRSSDGRRAPIVFLEPRCRVCRLDNVRLKVNDLLARGVGYARIVRALAAENSELDEQDRVTVDSVRNHTARHFPVQDAARSTYREILERRARENQIDFESGVENAVTPMALLETVMVKGYQALVGSEAPVSLSAAMSAAVRLQEVMETRGGSTDVADAMLKLDRIMHAVKSTVPPELWPEILEKMREDPSRRAFDDDDDDDVRGPRSEPM